MIEGLTALVAHTSLEGQTTDRRQQLAATQPGQSQRQWVMQRHSQKEVLHKEVDAACSHHVSLQLQPTTAATANDCSCSHKLPNTHSSNTSTHCTHNWNMNVTALLTVAAHRYQQHYHKLEYESGVREANKQSRPERVWPSVLLATLTGAAPPALLSVLTWIERGENPPTSHPPPVARHTCTVRRMAALQSAVMVALTHVR